MENNIGKEFMLMTRYDKLEPSAQSQGVPIPPLEIPLPEKAEIIPLPDAHSLDLAPLDLTNLIEKRATLRKYSAASLTLTELAFLLWGTQGVKSVSERR